MANTKSGTNIRKEYDVQNIVTAVILGAQEPMTTTEITDEVMSRCNGSEYAVTRDFIHNMVEETLMALQRVRACTCHNGKYYAYPNMGIGRLLRRGEI